MPARPQPLTALPAGGTLPPPHASPGSLQPTLPFLTKVWHCSGTQRKLSERSACHDFDEILAKIIELLQREKRVSYRALKRRFELDDDYIEDLKDELI